MQQIVKHFTDNDLYTFTCMYYIVQSYPRAEVEYTFFDRNKTVYPDGFDALLREQVDMMKNVVNLCTEYVNSGKIEIDGYEYCGRKHIVIRNKQNKDEFVDISVEYKTITMHINTIPKEFEAVVDKFLLR